MMSRLGGKYSRQVGGISMGCRVLLNVQGDVVLAGIVRNVGTNQRVGRVVIEPNAEGLVSNDLAPGTYRYRYRATSHLSEPSWKIWSTDETHGRTTRRHPGKGLGKRRQYTFVVT